MRTLGSWGEVAQPSFIAQWTRKGLWEQVTKEPAPRAEPGPAVGLGKDVEVLDLQQIAGPGPLDVHRSGQRVGYFGAQGCQVRYLHLRTYLAIRGVTGFEDHLLSRIDLQDRWNAGVPSVVTFLRLVLEPLAPVYLDTLHRKLLLIRQRRLEMRSEVSVGRNGTWAAGPG